MATTPQPMNSTSSAHESNISPRIGNSLRVEYVEPQYVEDFWGMISPGLWKAVRKSHGNEKTVERIRQSLASGTWALWLVLSEQGLEGFAMTEPLPDDVGWWVNIPFAWSAGREDTHTAFFDHLAPRAKEEGARGIKFASYRPGYGRVAKKKGWQVGMTQYIVEAFE